MAICVVNKKAHNPTANDYYIGRGSPLGNPFPITETDSRESVCAKYKEYLLEQVRLKNKPICNMLNNIYKDAKKGPVNLVCYCAPKQCHGDFIKELVESKLPVQP